MHYHCEVIMPPTTDIGGALEEILSPFSEHKDEDEEWTGNEFYDWYVVGGRFAGTKETCGYTEERLEKFYEALRNNKITVSGLQCGKQEISPAEQIPMVDKLWNEIFPTEKGEVVPCPLFAHSNNQYDGNDLISCDICLVEEIPKKLEAARVIIAGPKYDDKLGITFMISYDMWNGTNFVRTDWDGFVLSALHMMKKNVRAYKDEYREKITPKPNWICVTVDYHS